MTKSKSPQPKPIPGLSDLVAGVAGHLSDEIATALGDPGANTRRLAVDLVAKHFSDASSRNEVAAILRSHPTDIARDALWSAIHHDHEQIAAHEVGTMRLRDHADMLRSVTRGGASHLDADIPF